eukprot:4562631-Heterocapsa_arctica.AAC.1
MSLMTRPRASTNLLSRYAILAGIIQKRSSKIMYFSPFANGWIEVAPPIAGLKLSGRPHRP